MGIITEAEIGEVRFKPLKKISMLKATQKKSGNNTENHQVYFSGHKQPSQPK
jgi:hypothetical protein